MPSMVKVTRKRASGGKVSHLESDLPQRFNPHSSGQITGVFLLNVGICFLPEPSHADGCV